MGVGNHQARLKASSLPHLKHGVVPRHHAILADAHVAQRIAGQDVGASVVDDHVRLRTQGLARI